MAGRDPLSALNARIAATQRRMTWLALGQAFWPLFVFVGLFLALALSGGLDRLGAALSAATTIIFFLGSALIILRGWRAYRRPERSAAANALDAQSELRPVASLADRPVDPRGGAQSLWQVHRDRLLADASRLRPPSLAPEWKALDPFLLRGIIPSALACLIILTWPAAPDRLSRAFQPDLGALMGADGMVVEAWITPPAHTGRAPIFLKPGLSDVRVPQGSEITLRTKARTAPKLVLKGDRTRRQRFAATPDGAYEAKAAITEDTRVAVNWWGEREAWTILASPDDAPTALFVSMPFIGAQDRTEFTWGVADDYGVVSLQMAISLREPNPAAPDAEDRVAVPLPGTQPLEASETTQLDLTRHRWAGLAVNMTLVATDGAGQEGRSETIAFVLPEKLFLEPLARAAQEVRVTVLREPGDYLERQPNPGAVRQDALNTGAANRLDQAPGDIQKASLMLDAITYDGPRYIQDRTLYFALRMAHGILEAADSKAEADEIDTLLWAAALKAEYGDAADALRRLMAAKRALEQALRNGASEDEIKRRMEAFKDAANDYLAAKMAEAIANGLQEAPSNEDGEAQAGGPNMGGQDFEDMLQALQDLTETGASDQARQLLAEITNMLENLEFQEGQSGSGGMPGMPGEPGENAENEDLPEDEQELTEAMKRLSDILREQRELNDDTLAQERGETPNGEQPGQQTGEQGEQADAGQSQPGQSPGQEGQPGEQGAPGQQAGGQTPGQSTGDTGQGSEPGEQQAGNGQGEGREDGAGGGNGQQADNDNVGTGSGATQNQGETLAERQERLGELVEEFARRGGNGDPAGASENALEGAIDQDALEDARRAQRRAGQALERGNERSAARNQEQATRLLSDVARGIAGTLDELEEARLGEDGQGGQETDPFGRPTSGAGVTGETDTIPDAEERQRAKDILEELRRRYGEAEDEEEREYLERLLDRF